MIEELKLKSLGYRELKEGRWAKPVGFSLFTYFVENKEWRCSFRGCDNKLHTWESTIFKNGEEDDLVGSISYCEAYSKINAGSYNSFPFNTNEEIINNIL